MHICLKNDCKKIIIDFILSVIFLLLMWTLRAWFDWFLIFLFIGTFFGLLILKKYYYGILLSISFFVSLIWSIIAKKLYWYNIKFISLFGISSIPLFGWAFGLFAVYIIYIHLSKLFYIKKNHWKFLFFTFIYWFLLIMVETIAFHLVGIKDVANVGYKGLPICHCIHAPHWMQISYFSLGLIYFIIVFLFSKLLNFRKKSIYNNKITHYN